MKTIGFVVKTDHPAAEELALALAAELVAEGVHIAAGFDHGSEAEPVDLAVVLGGDGTMLRASRIIGDQPTPVLGINLGRLGFLAPFESDHAASTIRKALAGALPVTSRMRLAVALEPSSGERRQWAALNDAVIHQGAEARLVELNAYLDDAFIASYRADGLIIATPTGSTAYNLAAGGPILLPEQRAFAITPICAHALTMRPFVAPHSATIVVVPTEGEISLTIDGRWSGTVHAGDRLIVTQAPSPLNVLGSQEKSYFDILRQKMHWGAHVDQKTS